MDGVQVTDSVIGAIGGVAIEAGEAALIAEFPFLGFPVIKQIWEFFLNKLAAYIIENLQKGSEVLVIKMDVKAQDEKAKNAGDALQKAQGETDAIQRAKALEDFKLAYGDLTRTRLSTKR